MLSLVNPADHTNADLNTSTKLSFSSEEEHENQQYLIKNNRAMRYQHKTSNERAFIDYRLKKLRENIPFTYIPNSQPRLPRSKFSSNVNIDETTIKQLEYLSTFVVKIRVEFQETEITSYITGSGFIINDQYIITAGHIFDPLIGEGNVCVLYDRIKFTSVSYASDDLFNRNDDYIFEAEMIVRGTDGIGVQPYDICSSDNDIALLRICRYEEIKHMLISENRKDYFPPRLLDKAELEPDSPLFLLAYCSTIRSPEQVEFYEECRDYSLYTRENLNSAMHPDHRTVSIGKCITNDNTHIVHDCPSLRGASGGLMFNVKGKLVGVHTGVRDGDVYYNANGQKRLRSDGLNQGLAIYSDLIKNHLRFIIPKWK